MKYILLILKNITILNYKGSYTFLKKMNKKFLLYLIILILYKIEFK